MYTQYKHYFNNKEQIKFNVAIYTRVSREDEGEYSESESIANQKDFLQEVVIENGWHLVDIYQDDGISGTTFERPNFNRMIADIERGKVNLVITKDLSRLGRDYIQTGYYLENYFPSKNVRYIAVNDGFDTFDEDNSNDFIPFKSVFNDMYAKDISKKVRTALKTKQLNGSFLGTTAPYGYMKDPNNKGKLIVDPVSSVYVQKIFQLFLSGIPLQGLSNHLTKEGFPTPSQYANIKNPKQRFSGIWNDKTVRFMLKNEVYLGHMVQNKCKKVNYKIDKQIDLPRSQWIRVENTHEPIISQEDFDMVQEIMKKRSFHPPKGKPHIFTGIVFCGHCGTPYSHANQHTKGKYYIICGTAKRHQSLGLCESYMIKEEVFLEFVLQTIKEVAQEYINPEKIAEKMQNSVFDDMLKSKTKEKVQIQKRLEQIKKVSLNLYKDKINEVISEKTFQDFNEETEQEKEALQKQLETLEIDLQDITAQKLDNKQIKEALEEFLSFEQISRIALSKLVKKIVIYHDGAVDIHFTFCKPVRSSFQK